MERYNDLAKKQLGGSRILFNMGSLVILNTIDACFVAYMTILQTGDSAF